MTFHITREPDKTCLVTESGLITDARLSYQYQTVRGERALDVFVTAKDDALKTVILRWDISVGFDARLLTDDWERSYGTLEWRGFVPERRMPWYFLMSTPECLIAAGVMVRPNALCYWQVSPSAVTLVMDVRNGGHGVELGGRKLHLATVVSKIYEDDHIFAHASDFCGLMCEDPLLPERPVYGSNNWYYAYGHSSDREILVDAEYLASLTEGLSNRPYMIIDDCWQINDCAGPWHTGNEKFPDMRRLAEKIAADDVIPGIWVRLLCDRSWKLPAEWRLRGDLETLDPSHPGVLDHVGEIVGRFSDWGYKLIKHDFSVYDTLGHFAFNMPANITKDGWGFYDRSLTSAEIMKNFYKKILDESGGALILGCCVMNHLCAGYVHINRVGNDTSGKEWEKTRFCGVNSLAFKLFHHNKFYAVDADCAGLTEQVPWEMNAQWLDLLARSGTPLFVSSKKGVLNSIQMEVLREAYRHASVGGDHLEPLDWMTNTTPARWLHNGTEVTYNWFEDRARIL